MTRKARHDRIVQLIHQLAHLSRDGWHNADASEYRPLERELYALQLQQIPQHNPETPEGLKALAECFPPIF